MQTTRLLVLSLLLWFSITGCSSSPPEPTPSKSEHGAIEGHIAAQPISVESDAPRTTASEPEHQSKVHSKSQHSAHSKNQAESRRQAKPESQTEPPKSFESKQAAESELQVEVESETKAESSESEAKAGSSESEVNTESSSTKTLADIVEDLKTAAMLESGIPSTDFLVQDAKAVQWSDRCLEAPRSDEVCAQVITPGYQVILSNLSVTFEFHTDRTGQTVRQIRPKQSE